MTKYGQTFSFEAIPSFKYTKYHLLSTKKTYWGIVHYIWKFEVKKSKVKVTKGINMGKI